MTRPAHRSMLVRVAMMSRGSETNAVQRLVASVVVALLAGCAPSTDVSLLEVDHVEARLESGERLVLHGAGFPPGRGGVLSLEGTFHAPGEPSASARVEVPIRVQTATQASGRIDRDVVRAFGGRGTFVGQGCLHVQGRGARVSGCAPVHLDVAPAVPDALARARRLREATRLAEELGMSFVREGADDGAAVIARVTEGGVAARAGLREGDRIVQVGELRVRAPDEVLAPPNAAQLRLGRERAGRLRLVELPLLPTRAAAVAPALSDGWLGVLGGALNGGWLVLLAWLVLLVVGRPAMQRRATPTSRVDVSASERTRGARALRASFEHTAGTAALAALVAVALRLMSLRGVGLDLRLVAGLWVAARAMLLFTRGAARAPAELLDLFVLPTLALLAAILGGSAELDAVRRGVALEDGALGLLALNPLAALVGFAAVLAVTDAGGASPRQREVGLPAAFGAALVGLIIAPSIGVARGSLGIELAAVAATAASIPWVGRRASFVQGGRRASLVALGGVAGLGVVFLAAQGRVTVPFPWLLALVLALALALWIRPGQARRARVHPFL